MPETTPGSHRGPSTRRIWAISSVLLTLAMVTAAWVNRARVVRAVSELDQSQGEVLLSAIRDRLRTAPVPPDAVELDSLRLRHAQDNLRSLSLFSSDGRLIAGGGDNLSPEPLELHPAGGEPPPLTTRSGRIRMLGFFRPTRWTSAGAVWRAVGAGTPEPSPSVIVIEFDPILSRNLLASADRIFALAAAAGTVLVGLTLLFWRLSDAYELAQRRAERERRLAVLGEMSAVLAHEIRNPLASLKGNAQLLSRRLAAGSAEQGKAGLVVAEAQRLEALTTNLLDFVRSGRLEIQPVDPVQLVRACVEEVAPGGITVHADGAPAEWPMDGARVRQVVVNLLRNAVQASPPGQPPEVTVTAEGRRLVVVVQDAGGGIRPGDEERVFAPFYTTKLSGTGLGLAVARRIAEAHQGTLVASNHQGGARFRLELSALPAGDGHPPVPYA